MKDCITVRAAKKEDVGRLCLLERSCFCDPWSEAAFTFGAEEYFLAYEISAETSSRCEHPTEGEPCGYASVLHTPDGDELLRVAVLPQLRRRGIGGALLDAVLERSRKGGAGVMRLEVRASNAPARELYLSRGFCEIGVRRAYYRAPVEDACLMELRLG